MIVDDPQSSETLSVQDRQKMLDWFDKTIKSRGAVDNGRRVVVMARLHNAETPEQEEHA